MDLQDMPPALRIKLEEDLKEYFKLEHIGDIFRGWY
jgi:hypothetical protein